MFLFICLFIFLTAGSNAEDFCEYLQEDYDTLYNTSLNLYSECTSQLDTCNELWDNELSVNDVCMNKLQECENQTVSLKTSGNYTSHIRQVKQNIELESALLVQEKKNEMCEEKNVIAYSLVSDKTNEIATLKANLSASIYNVYRLDNDLRSCQTNLRAQMKETKNIFTNLNDCLEREELTQEQKNKYVLKLSSCRKNNRKLKANCTQISTEV
jgi:hypothetical protein